MEEPRTSRYQRDILNANHIIVDERRMASDDWTKIAFSLGIPAGDISKPNSAARRFAQRVKRRETISTKQTLDYLVPVFAALRKDHSSVCYKINAEFNQDAVPNTASVSDSGKHVSTPNPTFTFGYQPDFFSLSHRELQNGIIPDLVGQPCDLSKIAQLVSGAYWPFMVIEVADDSMLAAQHRCAVAAASCNHALTLLARATYRGTEGLKSLTLAPWDSSKAARSFSLAIHQKVAKLHVHHLGKSPNHVMRLIKSYKLDDEDEVELLLARIESLLVWAEHCRLPAVLELLDNFDRRVNGHVSRASTPQKDLEEIQIAHFKAKTISSRESDGTALKQRSRFKSMFHGRMATISKYLPAVISPLPTPMEEKVW